VRKVCGQVEKFIVSVYNLFRPLIGDVLKAKNSTQAKVRGGRDSWWAIGEGGVTIEQLVLVSLRRVSVGCWVPFLRLTTHG